MSEETPAERIAKFTADVERYTRQRDAAKAARIWDDARFWQAKLNDARRARDKIERSRDAAELAREQRLHDRKVQQLLAQQQVLAQRDDDFPCCSGGAHD